jgi:tRNA nucleotidyltransferase/poly(A) polymerase
VTDFFPSDLSDADARRATLEAFLASPLPSAVAKAAQQTGAETVLVGGAVRDLLLGQLPLDLDFAVAGDAIALARRCANQLGGAFYIMDAERGVARTILDRAQVDAEAPEGKWVCDFVVRRGLSWEEDLRDRDFTINAIACRLNSKTELLIDPLSGAIDLKQGILRMASPTAITSDPVRAVRGVRLAHQFGCAIEPATWRAMGEAPALLSASSAERVRDAFMDALALPDTSPHAAAVDLARLGLLDVIVPARRGADVWAPQLDLLAAAQSAVDLLRGHFAATTAQELDLHLEAVISEGRTRHVLLLLSALLPAGAGGDGHLKALRLSAAERGIVRRIHDTQAALDALFDAGAIDTGAQKHAAHRFLSAVGDAAPEALCYALARRAATPAHGMVGMAGDLAALYFDRYAPGHQPEPLLSGQDLLDAGMRPGIAMGKALDAVREAQLTGEIKTRQQALALVFQDRGNEKS